MLRVSNPLAQLCLSQMDWLTLVLASVVVGLHVAKEVKDQVPVGGRPYTAVVGAHEIPI